MSNKEKNLVVSLVFMAFGIFLFVESMGIKHMMKNDVGSAFFPKVVAVAITGVSVIRLIMTLREPASERKKSNSDLKGGWLTIVLIAAYVMAFQPVGFIISTMVYLFLQILVLVPKEKRSWPLTVIISVVSPIAIYALFTYAISSPLPKGIWGF